MRRLLAIWHRLTGYRFMRWATIDREFRDATNHNERSNNS